jgi:Na+/proline symporter
VAFRRPGYSVAVIVSIVISFIVGIGAIIFIRGESTNFFVAGRTLPLFMVTITLTGSSIDSNALLGNADGTYKFSFWDGVVLPLGLGTSLLLNGLVLAHHVNNEVVLTLPDIFARRYGATVEVLVSFATVVSFIMLLAGNLVGFAKICSYLWDIESEVAVAVAAFVIWLYTVSGGMFSIAYTDVVQGLFGFSGCAVFAFYMIATEEFSAPPPSIGFPGTPQRCFSLLSDEPSELCFAVGASSFLDTLSLRTRYPAQVTYTLIPSVNRSVICIKVFHAR